MFYYHVSTKPHYVIIAYCLYVGHLTPKSDIYSFGVVLLEMLSGKRVIDKNRPNGEQKLVEWAKPNLANKRKILRVLDPRIEGQYSLDHAVKVANLTLKCLSINPKLRPNMSEIVKDLEKLQVSPESTRNARETNQPGHLSRRAIGAQSCRQGLQKVSGSTKTYLRPSPIVGKS